jgi:choline dehydrogenase-like flavoprotein
MGDDPGNFVVDKYHRANDVPNLFMVDGSSFVTSGRNQPTCTIQALAYTAADHISRMAKSGSIDRMSRTSLLGNKGQIPGLELECLPFSHRF